jgi:hypothetical protein
MDKIQVFLCESMTPFTHSIWRDTRFKFLQDNFLGSSRDGQTAYGDQPSGGTAFQKYFEEIKKIKLLDKFGRGPIQCTMYIQLQLFSYERNTNIVLFVEFHPIPSITSHKTQIHQITLFVAESFTISAIGPHKEERQDFF